MTKTTLRLIQLSAALAAVSSACGDDSGAQTPDQLMAGAQSTGAAGTAVAGRPAAGSGGAGAAAAGSGTAGKQSVGTAGTGAAGASAGGAAAGSGGASAAGSGGTVSTAGTSAAGASAAGASAAGANAAGAGSGGSAGEAGSGMPAATKPPCLKKPSQVVVVGDSYLNWITHTFPDDLTREAGMAYRMMAVGGASMATGGISGYIPDQLTDALSADGDIIAAVMSGGGNDILIPDVVAYPESDTCKDRVDAPMLKVCQDVIAMALTTARKLMDTAAAAGIKDTIYLFYPHIPGGGFGGENPNYILDYSSPMAKQLCEGAEKMTSGKMRCHFLDLVPIFEGHADWFADDGIHENAMGSAQMAKEVVKIMKDECIAQPESSGCCTP